jgi:hypothetical protein
MARRRVDGGRRRVAVRLGVDASADQEANDPNCHRGNYPPSVPYVELRHARIIVDESRPWSRFDGDGTSDHAGGYRLAQAHASSGSVTTKAARYPVP